MCDEIQQEGVKVFSDAFDQLIDAISRKAAAPGP
jgi:hypothetical protein